MDAKGNIKVMSQAEAIRLAKQENAKVYQYQMPKEEERWAAIDPPELPLDSQESVYRRLYDTVKALEKVKPIEDRDALRKALAKKDTEFAAMQKHKKKIYEIITGDDCDADKLAYLMYGVHLMKEVKRKKMTFDEADETMMKLYDYLHLQKNQQEKKAGVTDPRKTNAS